MNEDTFVALSTPSGESAIAVIRLSGNLCLKLISEIFSSTQPLPRKAYYSKYFDSGGKLLDHVVYTYYKEGYSYTGDSMIEISSHGNPLIVQHIIEDLQRRGCRIAEPGEFTKTAFLNGKIDLSQAEAVMDLIRARSDRALLAAQKQLSGAIGCIIDTYVDRLLGVIANLEAYIDFPEEDLPDETMTGPIKALAELVDDLSELIATSHYSTLLHEGIKTVIVGPPNVGKSSFLNRLTGMDRAIVSEEPGTTRDFIEERILIGSYLLRIVDTAGIHSPESKLEKMGIDKTYEQVESADFVLFMVDSNEASPTLSQDFMSLLGEKPVIVVENKIDLPNPIKHIDFLSDRAHFPISVLKRTGLKPLMSGITKELESGIIVPDSEAVIVSARHASSLENAKSMIATALQGMKMGKSSELCASELRMALGYLGQVVGRIDNESMLDKLFSQFCIGK